MWFLCAELLSGKFCISAAGTLARSLSNPHNELYTPVADGMLPGNAVGTHSPFTVGAGSWLGDSIMVKALPSSLHVHAPLYIPGLLPNMKTMIVVELSSL